MYDLVIKGGFVIDPFQEINEVMDVAISRGKIVDVRSGINIEGTKHVVDASGLLVTPGLIDIHVHCSYNMAHLSVDPEFSCLAKGSTTVLDAGSMGQLNFMGFRKYLIDRSRTRILALLNIESLGMIEVHHKEEWPKLIMDYEEMFINIKETLKVIRENQDIITGIKWAHHTPKGLSLARKAADEAKCVLMAENHYEPETVKCLNKGDIITHIFHAHKPSLKRSLHDGLLDEEGNVQHEFFDAIKRGVILDVGHGAGSFSWQVAEEAFKQGIKPDTISTDLHMGSFNGPAFDLPTTMSKFLLLGMPLYDVVKASTITPAKVLGKQDEIGNLKPGACADLALFKLEEGKFVFTDVYENKRVGHQRLIIRKVIRGGEIII
jgi:dihydroorotase